MSLLKYCERKQDIEDSIEPTKRMRLEQETEYESEAHTTSTDHSKSSCSSGSNSKQAATFSKRWLKGREHWLRYVEGQGMFCLLCTKFKKSSFNCTFWTSTPCSRLRLQSITTHENSSAHKDAVKLELASQETRDIVSAINPPIPRKGIYQAFSCLYFLAKQRIAHTTNYEPLLDLLQTLGLQTKSDLHVAKNATYLSDKSIQEMLYVLSEVIEQSILTQVKESDHIALMLDETTDCTVTEQLALHCRYIEKASGNLKSCYLRTIDVLKPEIESVSSESSQDTCISVNAATITKRVEEFFSVANINAALKLRGIGTDGASTMIGHRNGVVTRLKKLVPTAIGIHCAAHRLNLASSQAADTVAYVKKFSSVLRQLFDFFDNSSVRIAGLQAIQTLLKEKGRLLAPCSTRWLSTERSVNRLKSCFSSVVLSLQRESEERSDAKALGLNRLITERRFISTMLLLCDALPHVTHLSKCFQLAECDYSIIPRVLTSTICSLQQLKHFDGTHLTNLTHFVDELTGIGITISAHSNLGDEYFQNSVREPYLNSLIKNLEQRFDDKSTMAAFDILNPSRLTSLPTTEDPMATFLQHGVEGIKELARQYATILPTAEECLEEWSSFRQYLKDHCTHLKQSEVIDQLCGRMSTLASIFPIMSTIGQICRVLPIHTADVERTFSQLKLIKTNIRNRMSEKTLDSLLRIVIEGPPLDDYPISDAVSLWAKKKNRRILP